MEELEGDKYLNIETTGIQWIAEASLHNNRYEATPYPHLKELFNRHPLSSDDGLVDFGCGKGRLNFYVHDRFACRATGIEMNANFCKEAEQNLLAYSRSGRHRNANEQIRFHRRMAEEYEVLPEDTVFYFFNPFSVQIFMKVVDNILRSEEIYPREVKIILYYPSDEYIDFLDRSTAFERWESIDLPAIKKDPAEQFLIYKFSPQ